MLDVSSMIDAKRAALDRAKEAAGGVGKLAEALGVTKQAVSQWDEVPPLRVLEVERASGVPRSELRPDLYPPEPAQVSA